MEFKMDVCVYIFNNYYIYGAVMSFLEDVLTNGKVYAEPFTYKMGIAYALYMTGVLRIVQNFPDYTEFAPQDIEMVETTYNNLCKSHERMLY